VIDNVPLAQLFTQEFNLLWGDGPGGLADSLFGVNKPFRPAQKVIIGDATVWVQFSPSSSTVPWAASSNGLIARMLSQANAQIDLALFVFSEQPLADVLEQQHNEGVEIRALIDPQFAYQNYSEALDLLGVALSRRNAPCTAEGNNRPWSEPIPGVGVPQLPEGDLLHHKYGVVDQTLVIIGSHNWSAAANQRNDETLLAIDHPTVAAHYQREFDRLYANSYLGIPDFLQEKLDTQDQECSTLTTPTQTASPSPLLSKQSTSSPEVAAPEGTAPVNLNTATQTELERLPGIGPKLAERIIVARQAKPFTSFADLDQVPGIGPKLLEELTNQVTW
jgi:competence ComEA-like helix-hairpin-helix protein